MLVCYTQFLVLLAVTTPHKYCSLACKVVRPMHLHKCSDTLNSHTRNMFRPAVSAINRRYYKNMKGKPDRTKERGFPILQYYSNKNYFYLRQAINNNTLKFLSLFVYSFFRSFVCLFVFGTTAPSGTEPPHSRGS
jgi:hypothetical protein